MAKMIEKQTSPHEDKLETVTTVTGINDSHNVALTPSTSVDWTPGFWPRFPWVGFGCLLGTLLLSTASLVILRASENKGYSQWSQHIAPHIILSIFNGFATLCIAVAVANGATITWWRQALHGTTVKKLQHTWSFSVSLFSIAAHLRYFNLAALAALAAKITIIDSVLFQRAATTKVLLTQPFAAQSITTYPTTEFPYTGYFNGTGNGLRAYQDSWINDLNTWSLSPWGRLHDVSGFGDCYDAVCAVNVSAIGFAATCVDETITWDPLQASCIQALTTNQQVYNLSTLFSVDFDYRKPTPEQNYTWIEMKVISSVRDAPAQGSTQMCPVSLKFTTCQLRPAMIRYPVYMQYMDFSSTTQVHDRNAEYVTVLLGRLDSENGEYIEPQWNDFNSSLQQLRGFEFERYLDIFDQPSEFGGSYVGGVVLALQDRFQTRVSSNIHAWYDENVKSGPFDCKFTTYVQIDGAGVFGATSQNITDDGEKPYGFPCAYSFQDPFTQIMVDLNTLMFITSQDLWNRNVNYENATIYEEESRVFVQGQAYFRESHYTTDWGFAWGAFAATVVCILCVLPSYWGFWELGRPVTLSPIEIANAFQAPVLVQCQDQHGFQCVHANDVVRVAGREKVRYGAFQEPDRREPIFRFTQATTDV